MVIELELQNISTEFKQNFVLNELEKDEQFLVAGVDEIKKRYSA
ncbi:hypothetical protein [Methanolapillus ohkumae]|uniref:Uncharacterized protein n=1 Tax=Methanolapillus ohkumae TaxID=3028298 RepID=A0AA96V4C5_9EURY|nr:hypothetical protein MsAm2_01090 [Methanosarcinaceae archaeon Am2]